MKTIQHLSEFDELRSADQAIVFLFAGWSIYAIRGRDVMRASLEQFGGSDLADSGVSWWMIDLSEQSGAIFDATFQWLRTQTRDAEYWLSWGAGTVIWCRHGKLQHRVLSAEHETPDSILHTTRALQDVD